MKTQVKSLFEKARKLTAAEREELARLLIGTLGTDMHIEAAWAREADKRLANHRASGEATIDAFEAVEQVRAQLGRRRRA